VEPVTWPEGRRFAFSIFEDTDSATLENVGPVYAFLEGLGFRTTKSVWPLPGMGVPDRGGSTCAAPRYRDWALSLQHSGFEIGGHNAGAPRHAHVGPQAVRRPAPGLDHRRPVRA
jgi:hypothetical protein